MDKVAYVAWRAVVFAVAVAGGVDRTAAGADKGTGKTPSARDAIPAEAVQHVEQALLAETRGDNAERARQLAGAALVAPDYPPVQWHRARVRVEDEWLSLAEAMARAAHDPRQQQYLERRAKAAGSVKSLRELARWCQKNDRADAAQLHYQQLLLHPAAEAAQRQEAIEKLELQQVGGTWLTRDELLERQTRARAVEAALAAWRPRLKMLQEAIDSEDYDRRKVAAEKLRALDDPQIIAPLESFLLDGGPEFQQLAVERLATFPQYEATEALVRYAVLSSWSLARDKATEALRARPLHESLPLLLGGLTAPLQSQFSISAGRGGTIQYTHVFVRETAFERLAAVRDESVQPQGAGRRFLPGLQRALRRAEASRLNQELQAEQLARLEQTAFQGEAAKNLANAGVEESNRRLFDVLEQLVDAQQPRQPAAWWTWWQQFNEYQWPRPTRFVYQTQRSFYTPYQGASCFLAGTPIRTETGQRPIETIQPGDRVLAQDPDTGELAFRLVSRTTLRPPAEMVRIVAAGDELTTTLGHPLWVVGHGWKMAKQLAVGDRLHGLGGAVEIERIEHVPRAAAHNLVVEDFHTYFAGAGGLLVHDNEFRRPTRAIVPGLPAERGP